MAGTSPAMTKWVHRIGRTRSELKAARKVPLNITPPLIANTPSAARWIGQPMPRLEDAALLSGRARFMDDLTPVSGLKHAAILRSPHPHARIRGIDTSEAEKLPGVIGVVTGAQIATVAGVIPSVVRSKVRYQVCATVKARDAGEPVAVGV